MLADVKMLNFFRNMGMTAAVVLGLLALLSMLVQNFWCRYLCPYGALLGLASLLSPLKIRRDAEACIDCGKCAKVCPASLKVDQLVQIRSVECAACLQCVSACPAEDALQFALPARKAETAKLRWTRRVVSPALMTFGIAYIFFGVVLFARATGHWKTDLPREVYMELVPNASQLSHPMSVSTGQ
jgi:polyferredoxin